MRYSIQSGEGIDGLRITDNTTDSRVATCYAMENAKLVCDALNWAAKGGAKDFVPRDQQMSANDYQREALRTEYTPPFATVPTDAPLTARELERLIHGMFGICTETGELQDMMKKHLIYGKPFDRVNVMEECGDILWYIALTLHAAGYSMTDSMERNIAKLRKRFPDKFTSEKALTRDLTAERNALENK